MEVSVPRGGIITLNADWQQKKTAIINKRMWVWFPMALAYFVGFFHRNAGALVGESLKVDFAITSAAQLGFLTSIFFYTSAIMQIPSGIIADKFDPKKGLMIAMALIILGTIVSARASTLAFLYLGRLILSIGAAMIYINLFKITTDWWRTSEMGTISSYTSLAGNAGPLVATVPLAILISSVGWRGSYYVMAAVVGIALLLCHILTQSKPSNAGLPSWAEIEAQEKGKELKRKADNMQIKAWESIKKVAANKQTMFPAIACAGMYGSFMAFAGMWAVPYFIQIYGLNQTEAAGILLVGQIAYMIAGPLNGILSDKYKLRQRLFSAYTFVGFIGWLLFAFWGAGKPPMWGIYVIIVLIYFGCSPLFMAFAYAREVNSPTLAGISAGVVNVGTYVGAGLMQPFVGMVLENYWDGTVLNGVRIYSVEAFQTGFICCAIAMGIAWLSTLFMVETRCKNIYHSLINEQS